MKPIAWIASYPKSGNTWFRAFLTALIGRDLEESVLEGLEGGPIASALELFELEVGVSCGDLKLSEVQAMRADVFRSYANRSTEPLYLKIHDARIDTTTNTNIIPSDLTHGAIYLIRNPLDIAGSWANHNGSSIEKAVRTLTDPKHTLSKNGGRSSQVLQFLGSWSYHVDSWTNHQDFPVLVLRYEDLLADPTTYFTQAADFLKIGSTTQQIEEAIEKTSFDKLQNFEKSNGFKERPYRSEKFFRKGKSGTWREELTDDLAQEIIEQLGETMKKFDYLDTSGTPIF